MIQADLVQCDAGVVQACRDLGSKLEKAKRFDEASPRTITGATSASARSPGENDACHDYGPREPCDAALCSKCSEANRSDPECRFWQPPACADRAMYCKFETLANCLDVRSALQCARASRSRGGSRRRR